MREDEMKEDKRKNFFLQKHFDLHGAHLFSHSAKAKPIKESEAIHPLFREILRRERCKGFAYEDHSSEECKGYPYESASSVTVLGERSSLDTATTKVSAMPHEPVSPTKAVSAKSETDTEPFPDYKDPSEFAEAPDSDQVGEYIEEFYPFEWYTAQTESDHSEDAGPQENYFESVWRQHCNLKERRKAAEKLAKEGEKAKKDTAKRGPDEKKSRVRGGLETYRYVPEVPRYDEDRIMAARRNGMEIEREWMDDYVV
jgi:hypothetical protein